MLTRLAEKIEYYRQQYEPLPSCHQAIIDLYPGAVLRWARIYGRRWEHVGGDQASILAGGRRIQINDHWGLVIDDQGLISDQEMLQIIEVLKEYLL